MIARTSPDRITFAVAPVARTRRRRMAIGPLGALRSLAGSGFIACSAAPTDFIGDVGLHPLIAAAAIAFDQRRPLTLAPDMIWAALVQGAARHVINHTAYLRPLVGRPAWGAKPKKRQGQGERRAIRLDGPAIATDSPRGDWAEVVAALWAAVHEPRGATTNPLAPNFSTTGPAERFACQVAPLDPVGRSSRLRTDRERECGIPRITLEGTPADWRRLRAQVEHLAPYFLDWWLPSVRAICDQFVRAADGDVDLDHWRGIQGGKETDGDRYRGSWLLKLTPYLRDERGGPFAMRNPLLADPDATPAPDQLPTGLGMVPFRCPWRGRADAVALEWFGGFLGVTQDPVSLALRPHLGWAIRPGAAFDPPLARLEAHAPRPPLEPSRFERLTQHIWMSGVYAPGLREFYQVCDGVRLLDRSGTVAYRFLRLDDVAIIEDPAGPPELAGGGKLVNAAYFKHHDMLRFCDLADGSFFALGPRFAAEAGESPTPGPPLDEFGNGWKVVLVTPAGAGNLATCPVVAWSFDEFLRRVLDGERLTDAGGSR